MTKSQEQAILDHLESGQRLDPMGKKEIWKPVKGFKKFYSISNFGRIRRDCSGHGLCKSGRILRIATSKDGYKKICLCKYGKQYTKHIAHMVLEAFIGGRPNGYETNHKDGNKLNNKVSNLEYVTRAQNIAHAWENGLRDSCRGENHCSAIIKEKEVVLIRKMYATGLYSIRGLAKMVDISVWIVTDVILKRTWKHIADRW